MARPTIYRGGIVASHHVFSWLFHGLSDLHEFFIFRVRFFNDIGILA